MATTPSSGTKRTFSGEQELVGVPDEYRDLAAWPAVEASLLDARDQSRVKRYSRAIEMKLSGCPLVEVAAAAGTGEREFRRVFKRCLSRHPDGRIWGLRAIPSGVRVRKPMRKAPFRPSAKSPSAGYVGMFAKVLYDRPQIEKDLVYALTSGRKDVPSLNRYSMRKCHQTFLGLCRTHGVAETEYPFNIATKGRRAFQRWMQKEFMPRYASAWVRMQQGESAAQAYDYQGGDGSSKPLLVPYKVWELDEVTIDQEGRYELPNAIGDWDQLDLRRCSAIRLIETGATATLAWKLILAPQPTTEEILMVIWDALNGPPKVSPAIPGLDYAEGAGYPANVFSHLRFAIPKFIDLDNALAHLAGPLQNALGGSCGIVIRLGSPRTPQARARVEAKFKLQAQRVIHQLPGTTGSGPQDPVRKKAAVDVKSRVRVDELEHVLDVYIANENATPAAGAGYIAPLERLQRQIAAEAIKVNYLPAALRRAHYFNAVHHVQFKVDHKNHRRPFVNFLGVRYTSAQLQRAYALTGKKLWVRFDPRDLRTLLVFLDDGTEFGAITAMGQWSKFRHDLRIRKLYLKLKRMGELAARPEDEPLDALLAHLRSGAPRNRSKALQLAHLMSNLQSSIQADERPHDPAVQHMDHRIARAREDQGAYDRFDSVPIRSPDDLPAERPHHPPPDAANEPLGPLYRAQRLPRRAGRR